MHDANTTAAPSIYSYGTIGAFLSAHMHWRKAGNPRFSYRYLCKRLGLPSTSKVAMIATGKRLPTDEFLQEIWRALGLGPDELRYAGALIGQERARGDDEKQLYADKLDALRPAGEATTIGFDAFEFISRWHHIAILEMTALPDFMPSPAWVAARLGGLVDAEAAAQSLELLQRLGLLRRDEQGRLERTAVQFTTPRNIPSTAIRAYHQQILDLAKAAIEQQTVAERYFSGTTIPLDTACLPEAQKLIVDVRRKLARLASKSAPNAVYHFSLQLFRLTAPVVPPAADDPT